LSEFIAEYVNMKYGLKTIAVKQLSALIAGLEKLSKRGHPYGTLFCRLLHVHTDQPLDESITQFLTSARAAFVEA
jgi:hypothetical protein